MIPRLDVAVDRGRRVRPVWRESLFGHVTLEEVTERLYGPTLRALGPGRFLDAWWSRVILSRLEPLKRVATLFDRSNSLAPLQQSRP